VTTLLLAALWGACLLALGYAFGLAVLAAWAGRKETRRAEQKAATLLRSWLTAEEVRRWESQKEIEVVGSHTGTRYRIRRAKVMNIDELDAGGRVVRQWCFAPQGNLVLGDVIIAQKIALETMETKALASANWRLALAGGLIRL
jgi:hypothetical protein